MSGADSKIRVCRISGSIGGAVPCGIDCTCTYTSPQPSCSPGKPASQAPQACGPETQTVQTSLSLTSSFAERELACARLCSKSYEKPVELLCCEPRPEATPATPVETEAL